MTRISKAGLYARFQQFAAIVPPSDGCEWIMENVPQYGGWGVSERQENGGRSTSFMFERHSAREMWDLLGAMTRTAERVREAIEQENREEDGYYIGSYYFLKGHGRECSRGVLEALGETATLDGVWDGTPIGPDDVVWDLKAARIARLWLANGTYTCRCDG